MTKEQIQKRQKAVAAAIGSVQLEGLEPSEQTIKNMKQFAEGKIDAQKLRAFAIVEAKR